MAIQFHPLPAELFPASLQPYIKRHNVELREIFGLEGTIRQPLTSRKSDLSVTRRGDVQVDVSRITPSITQIVSGQSTVVGTPALTFGLVNVVGSTTTAISIGSTIALFGTAVPTGLSESAAVGTSAYAARADHVHQFPTTLRSSVTGATFTFRDDGLDYFIDISNPGGILTDLTWNIQPTTQFGVRFLPNSVTAPNDTIVVSLRPGAGSRSGLNSSIVTAAGVSSATITAWNANMLFGSADFDTATLCAYRIGAISANPTAGSDTANKMYGYLGGNPTISSANGGWSEVAAAYFGGPKRSLSNPTVTLGAGIIVEVPTISGTTQIGVYVKQQTAQQTATNRIGLRIDAQNSGTNRWSIKVSDRIENDTTDIHVSASGKGFIVKASDDTTRWLRIRALYNGGAPSLTIDDIGTTQPGP